MQRFGVICRATACQRPLAGQRRASVEGPPVELDRCSDSLLQLTFLLLWRRRPMPFHLPFQSIACELVPPFPACRLSWALFADCSNSSCAVTSSSYVILA